MKHFIKGLRDWVITGCIAFPILVGFLMIFDYGIRDSFIGWIEDLAVTMCVGAVLGVILGFPIILDDVSLSASKKRIEKAEQAEQYVRSATEAREKSAAQNLLQSGSVNIQPQTASEWLERANALDTVGRVDEALQAYNNALRLEPNDAAIWYNLAVAQRNAKRYLNALEAYAQAERIAPRVTLILLGKADTLALSGKYSEAVREYDGILVIEPQNMHAMINKCAALWNSGQRQQAARLADRILATDPAQSVALKVRSSYAQGLGAVSEGTADVVENVWDNVFNN